MAKKFILAMFPYPSGNLHMGHLKLYSALSLLRNYYTYKGHDVFSPFGWDALGQPAEQAAITFNMTPKEWTNSNILYMRQLLKDLVPNLDWNAEFSTSWDEYKFWIQDILIDLYRNQYLYHGYEFMNYDPIADTFLSNEQVVDGKAWRTDSEIIVKPHRTWFVDIRKIIQDIEEKTNGLDWPSSIKTQQVEWIGKKEVYDFGETVITKDGQSIKVSLTGYKNAYTNPYLRIAINNPIAFNLFSHTDCIEFMKQLKSGTPYIKIEHCTFSDSRIKGIEIVLEMWDAYSCLLHEEGGDDNDDVWTTENKTYIYKIRNWSIGRNRSWGIPIPAIEINGDYILDEKAKKTYLEDTNCHTLDNMVTDTFVDSSIYYIFFCIQQFTNKNKDTTSEYAAPVDVYLGGSEFATSHLLYARIMTHILYKLNWVNFKEPFKQFIPIGLIMHMAYIDKDSQIPNTYVFPYEVDKKRAEGKNIVEVGVHKMSKSKRNYVNLEKLWAEYGKILKIAILSDTPFSKSLTWKKEMVNAPIKFLDKLKETNINLHRAQFMMKNELELSCRFARAIEGLKFNVAISIFYESIKSLNGEFSVEFFHYVESIRDMFIN